MPLDQHRTHPDLATPAGPEHHPSTEVPGLAARTTQLLRTGVPLTLLLDLAEEDGPRSAQHYASEGGDLSWVRRSG